MASVVLSSRPLPGIQSPVSASKQSVSEDRTSLTDAILSRKQQRSMKIFFKRTTRPLLRSFPPMSRGTTSKEPSTFSTPPAPVSEDPSINLADSDPLPLLAQQELARCQKQSRSRTPLDSALSAVDWVASDLAKLVIMAQGVTFPDWPAIGSGKGKARVVPVEEEEEADVAEEGEVESSEAQRQALENLMMGPRCAWPKQTLSTQSASTSIAIPTPSVEYPRCAWPRKETTRVFSTEPQAAPRCPWPRGSSPSAASSSGVHLSETAPAQTESGVDQTNIERDSLERIWASEPNIAAPHCAWPRRKRSLAPVAAPRCAWPRVKAAPALRTSEEVSPGPRCAWPKASLLTSALTSEIGARCAWPKTSPSGDSSVAPRCAYPRAGLMTSALETAVLTPANEIEAGPRCAYPRAGSSVAGPRCAWPKVQAATNVEVTPVIPVTREGPAGVLVHGEEAIQATATALSSPSIQVAVPPSSPRCAWPRNGPMFFSPEPVVIEGGARCAWPRTAGAVTGVSAPVVNQGGARCAWPRKNAGVLQAVSQEGTPVTSESSAGPVEGPRCSWPKEGGSKEESPVGPRCVWPRNQS